MIASRRKAHRLGFSFLAVGLPVLIAASHAWRPVLPPPAAFSAALSEAGGIAEVLSNEPHAAIGDYRIVVASARQIVLLPQENLLAPDVLVYWTPDTNEIGANGPGERARLLGRLAGRLPRRLQLPTEARGVGESLVLFGLAQQRVLARLPLEAIAERLRDSR